jgi:hypothetical protein
MSQWKNTDSAANSVLWAPDLVKTKANTTTQSNIFGNTTVGAFIPGVAVGQFGVDTTEVGVGSAAVALTYVTVPGSGYTANATVTLTWANGTTSTSIVNAFANVSSGTVGGSITQIKIADTSTKTTVNPTITIAAPTAINIVANTVGVNATADTIKITTANTKFQAGDKVLYLVPASNTAIAGLTNNTSYFVTFANATEIAVSTTLSGVNVDITEARTTATGEVHTLTGETAAGYVVIGGAKNKGIPHAGWVLRTEGTGGRAGRVQYEVLVASSTISSDAADDTILPDA